MFLQEIDYSNEGRNADRFSKNFAAFDWVKVPKIYWEYTTPQVRLGSLAIASPANKKSTGARSSID
jgi:hypothetical protein